MELRRDPEIQPVIRSVWVIHVICYFTERKVIVFSFISTDHTDHLLITTDHGLDHRPDHGITDQGTSGFCFTAFHRVF